MIGNILGLALSVLPKQSALLYRWQGRGRSPATGHDIDVFGAPEGLIGNIQPIDRMRYGYMGLDATKSYIAIYTSMPIADLSREHNPDQIEYQGRRYRVMSAADWKSYAGFSGHLAVDIGPATGSAP